MAGAAGRIALLFPRLDCGFPPLCVVGLAGFEPTTSPTPRERATKLRHSPLWGPVLSPARMRLAKQFQAPVKHLVKLPGADPGDPVRYPSVSEIEGPPVFGTGASSDLPPACIPLLLRGLRTGHR